MASFAFPKLDLKTPERSNHDLSHTRVGSFTVGTLNPVLNMDVLPGDHIKVNLNALIESFPMLAPAMSGYKVSFDAYFCPWSNYYGWMSNDTRLSTEQIIKRKRHVVKLGFDSGVSATHPVESILRYAVPAGSLIQRLGIPAGWFGQVEEIADESGSQIKSMDIPAESLLAYYDVYRHYYVNNQESNAFVGSCSSVAETQGVEPLSLTALDSFYRWIRNQADGVNLNSTNFSILAPALSYVNNYYTAGYRNLCGLALRTYRMDLLRGVLSSTVGSYKSTIDVSGDSIAYDTILEAGKLFDLIQRIDVTGGRFSDWMYTRWHVKPYNDIHRPIYLGTVSQSFGNRDIIAPSAGTQYDQDGNVVSSAGAGQQTGFAVGQVNREKGFVDLRSNQYGTLLIVMSMVPLVRYSQGFDLSLLKTTFADIYDPAFKQIGYQDVSRYELSAIPEVYAYVSNTEQVQLKQCAVRDSIAKRVAWSEYMGFVDKADGLFAQGESLDYWAFNRVYTRDTSVPIDLGLPHYGALKRYGKFDMSTYVLPMDWNHLFADNNPGAENFRYRISFDIWSKRPIGNRVLPHS